jgi:hypothetical protein
MNYDIINHNIATYEEAKKLFPTLEQFEKGEVAHNILHTLGLSAFQEFYAFMVDIKNGGCEPIIDKMTWQKLQPLIIEATTTPRFKKYISNKTQPAFKKILLDNDLFDRLLNGRWLIKPNPNVRRLRRGGGSGRRSHEQVEGLTKCIIPIINYMIQNNMDISVIQNQTRLARKIKWYVVKLDIDSVPKREIDVTNNLLDSLVSFVDESKIDFRKLNFDYLTGQVNKKLLSLMTIEPGTNIKCISVQPGYESILTKDKYYEVKLTTVSGGYLCVLIVDNRGVSNYYRYSFFEDMGLFYSIHRNDLLSNLFDDVEK